MFNGLLAIPALPTAAVPNNDKLPLGAYLFDPHFCSTAGAMRKAALTLSFTVHFPLFRTSRSDDAAGAKYSVVLSDAVFYDATPRFLHGA
jgi:hypothetical protein